MTKKRFVPFSRAGQVAVQPLPRGWECKKTSEGMEYYVDHNTRTVTWQRPEGQVQANQVSNQPTTSTSLATQPQTSSLKAILPKGWEEKIGTSGRTYFIDHNRRCTQWIDPREWIDPNPKVSSKHRKIGTVPLPDGWEMRLTKVTHKPYFVDHGTKSTSWDDPRV